jgi:hypothetical protein
MRLIALALLVLLNACSQETETCTVDTQDEFGMLDSCLRKPDCHMWPNDIQRYAIDAQVCRDDVFVKESLGNRRIRLKDMK